MFDREIAVYLSIKYVNVSRHVFLNLNMMTLTLMYSSAIADKHSTFGPLNE